MQVFHSINASYFIMIADRLKQIVEYVNVSPRAFALRVGTSSQVFGTYLKGTAPSCKVLGEIIEVFPDIDADWLLTGNGEMLKSAPTPQMESNAPDRALSIIESQQETINRQSKIIEVLTNK